MYFANSRSRFCGAAQRASSLSDNWREHKVMIGGMSFPYFSLTWVVVREGEIGERFYNDDKNIDNM